MVVFMKMTENQRWLSGKYLAYQLFTNMWFMGAVWLYFYRIFVTDQQVGIFDGLAFAIGLIAEVPSGALADRFGRDKIVKLGQVLIAAGLFTQALGSAFMPFLVGQSITMIGVAFASGADDALFFEQLNFKKDSVHWRKLVARGSQLALIGSLVAITLGGFLYEINPRIPWMLTGACFIIATLVILPVTDTRPRSARKSFGAELKEYLKDIKTGFAQFYLPKLWLYVPLILTVQGIFYTAGWGLLRIVLLDRFHFSPFWGSIALALCSLITVGILAFIHRYAESMSEKQVLSVISLSAVAALLLSLADIGPWGFVVILALYAGEHILHPFMSEVLNDRAPEHQRATVLSVASFLRTLPYVVLAPIIGYLSTNHMLEYLFVLWAVLISGALFLYVSAKKQDARVKLGKEDFVGEGA
jgi:MFS family permease